jgi:D-3-phosphoglycerate dehydrogenase
MNILITDKMAPEAIDLLKNTQHNVIFDEMDGDKLLDEIQKYHALMVRSRTKVLKEIIEKGVNGKLKVIGRAGIGVDNIDIKVASKYGIPVVNSPTGATISVSELTFGLIMALSRYITLADKTMKEKKWEKKLLKGFEIYGKTLGLIGTGNIGKYIAKIAQCYNMKVIGYDPFINKEEMKEEGIDKIDDLENLMTTSDYISLHLPHNPKTHHLINERMISKMKPTAFLINCARGGTVDEKALYNALKNHAISGAAIDVFEEEPLGDNPLTKLDNVILTPHLGANTIEGQIRAGTICANQIIKVLNGEEPDYCVNAHFL